MAKKNITHQRQNNEISTIFKNKRTILKQKLDETWHNSPKKAKPILDKMQNLISITEEFNNVNENLFKIIPVIKDINQKKGTIAESLISLLTTINELKKLKPQTLSSGLLSFITKEAPDCPLKEAILFENDEVLNILIDGASKLKIYQERTSMNDDSSNSSIEVIEAENDNKTNKKPELKDDSPMDDSEYILFEHTNNNELPFDEVFKKE